jgi:hypothetical protein
MVQRAWHKYIEIHGNIGQPDPRKGSIHFPPDKAHMKEWRDISPKDNVTIRPGKSFTVKSHKEVEVIDLEHSVEKSAEGRWTMYYDDQLQAWFDFVASRV